MSKSRQDPDRGIWVRTYAVTHPPTVSIPERAFARWHQLTYAEHGVMEVDVAGRLWVVPPHRALWLPAGTSHHIRMSGNVSVRTLFFTQRLAQRRDRIVAFNVAPLLRELILHATRVGPLRRDTPEHRRLAHLLLDRLDAVEATPLQLPMPRDVRARRAAALLIESHGALGFDALASGCGASKRTLERLFRAETAMSLGRWRTRARVLAALRMLARGASSTEIALETGYQSPSAFIAAFKAELGATPQTYFHS